MRKFLPFLVLFVALLGFKSYAAMFEASPLPLQEASKNVVITFNALESGVEKLQNLSTDLYAHLGVYTTKSPNSWSHVHTDWGTNDSDNCFKRVAANKFELTIGDMRSYFKITDASEKITKICVIARTADGKVQTKDFFIDVEPEGFAMAFSSNPVNTVINSATKITFKATTSDACNLKIYVDGKSVKEANNVTSIDYSQDFNVVGANNEVKAVATKGSEKIEKTINVFYVTDSPKENYPGGVPKQGAVLNSDGSVTFCLAAPGKKSVVLVGSWDNYVASIDRLMKRHDYNGYSYFWTTVKGLNKTTPYPYYYLVDGKYRVGDPYSHLVLDCYNDKWIGNEGADPWPDRPKYPYDRFDDVMLSVYQGNLDDFNWSVKDFAAKNPVAYTNRNAMTIYELLFRDFTGTDHKPDGTVRGAIEKIPYLFELGVTAVELMPIMQFDGNNSWGYNTNFYMAPDKSYGSPNDYKVFIDVCHSYGIAVILDIVFNHTPGLAPWYQMYDEGTSPFYNVNTPHTFGVYNDIKQEYPLVEQHWIDVLTYWLTVYKVDGFRFDLVKGLADSNSYGDNDGAYNQSRIDRMDRLYKAMKKINPNVIHINEAFVDYNEECEMGRRGMMCWVNKNGDAANFAKGYGQDMHYFNPVSNSRPWGSTVDYAESHDEQRVGYLVSTEGDKDIKSSVSARCKRIGSMAAQMLMQPGPKMIWQFGEYANDENTKKDGNNDTGCKAVGFKDASNAPRAALQKNFAQLNFLRRSNPELFCEGAEVVYNNFSNDNNVRSTRLTKGDKEIILFVNATSSKATVSCQAKKISASNSKLITETNSAKTSLTGTGTVQVSLPAHSFAVYSTPNVAGVEEITADEAGAANHVYAAGHRIVIEGEYTHAAIYDMSGRAVASGAAVGGVTVASGLYVVNVDGHSTKLLVK